MATTKIPLSDELQRLDRQSWVSFVQENGRNARTKGVTEGDVDRLISEVRDEHRAR